MNLHTARIFRDLTDNAVATMTEWATGIVQVTFDAASRDRECGVYESHNGETTHIIPAAEFRALGFPAARFDDEADDARRARNWFRAAAVKYGYR